MRDDDAQWFEQVKLALKNAGFSKHHIAQTCQLIAAILYLGNLEFTVDRGHDVNAAVVRNQNVLALVAEFFDPDGAADNRDDLAKTLYSLLSSLLNEKINEHFYWDNFVTFIGLFDLPWCQNLTSRSNSLDQFAINFANKRLHDFVQKKLFVMYAGLSTLITGSAENSKGAIWAQVDCDWETHYLRALKE
jgi:chitin synthase